MAFRIEELLVSLRPQALRHLGVEEFGITPLAGCEGTGCGATGCYLTDCGATGCDATGCGATDCGNTGCGNTGCDVTACGNTGCGNTGCGATDCYGTHCGKSNCGVTPVAEVDFGNLVDPVPELVALRNQLSGLVNLVKISPIYKTEAVHGGVAIPAIIDLERRLSQALTDFYGSQFGSRPGKGRT